ncbi:MAG: TetR/AcrR family transcriptional regulator [Parvibaculaceae bacterium]|nr:TetR/AcrR family transcriptional regulator [Parvibaculaceae bacterium]
MVRDHSKAKNAKVEKSKGTSRSKKREETSARIVQAARQSFAKRGFHGTSTRDIASEAGTNQGLITYHFGTKDALWRAAADNLFEEIGGRLFDRLGHRQLTDERENARESIREFVRFSAEHPEFFWLMVDEGKNADERLDWLITTHLRPRFEVLADYMLNELGYSQTELPHVYYTLAGAASLIFAVAPECRQLTGVDPLKQEIVERHADFVARLLIA